MAYNAPTYFAPTYFGAYFQTEGVGAVGTCASPSLVAAQIALASRLNDPTYVRWTAAELAVYLREALRTWNVWTSHWRGRASVDLPMATPFVDVVDLLATLRSQSVTNWDLVRDIQYALLEPAAAGGTWTGTAQFSLVQISTAIARRRDQFLRETGCVQTRSAAVIAAVPSSGRIPLPTCTLQVRRVAWASASTGALLPLTRADAWSANTFAPSWPASATAYPIGYSVTETPPLTLQITPPPSGPGTLDLITVNAGEAIDPAVEASLGIPDDYVWVIKFGVLADLLSNDGLAIDMARSAYCEARWQQGVELARRAPVVLAAQINGSPIRIGSLADADAYTPTWQLLAGRTSTILLAGQTLWGIYPPVGGVAATLLVDVVKTVAVPVAASDLLDIPLDIYDTILDLAQHLALFKEGPGQVEQALPLLERAARAAGVDLSLQQAAQPARRPLIGQQQQDSSTKARRLEPVGVEGI